MLVFSFENAVEIKNSFGEIKIDKRNALNGNRIDPVDACIDAHFCKMLAPQAKPADVNRVFDDYLTEMGW